MPKVSLYELEHMSDETNFEKVRSKKRKQTKETKHPEKKNHREKKIELWDYPEESSEDF